MILLELLLFVVIISLGIAGYKALKNKEEAEEKAYIDALIKEAEMQEHEVEPVQVVEVKTPEVLAKIMPREDWYYEALDLLAHLIWSEVGDEGEESMWKAGSVVMNRIKHHEYPNDLYSVIYQKGQYEVTWNGGLYKEEPPDIAYEVAAELLNSGSILPSDVLYQAEFTQGSGVYDKIGNTYYCYK